MRILLGLDDTDAPAAGCTGHLAWRLSARLAAEGWRLWAPARLVRLNPMTPYRTRGNAALCLPLEGAGRPEAALASTVETVRLGAQGHAATSPGIVVAEAPLPEAIYRETVQRLVDPAATRKRLAGLGLLHAGWRGGRGLTGALAACAWPAAHGTWELVSYRTPDKWGTARPDLADVSRLLDTPDGAIFDSHDPRHDVARIAPRGHDPVLWAIRGTDPTALVALSDRYPGLVLREPPAGTWLLATNQATDDHLVPDARAEAFTARRLAVAVSGEPVVRTGGHVFVPALWEGPEGPVELTLAAFEPTKEMARAAARLRPGDRIVACGSFGADAGTMNLEKFHLRDAAPRIVRTGNPRCDRCKGAMRSAGRAAGYRCRRCGERKPGPAVVWSEPPGGLPRGLQAGGYEAAVCARRHLARPLVLERKGPGAPAPGPSPLTALA